ncbi:MAG: NAD(P)/FAD-dependent oxidoreductase [Pseudomonadota bacterium]
MNETEFEVIILGTGPAGLQAAIHAARSKASVLLLGKRAKSSISRAHVENFCCIEKIGGGEMLEAGLGQAIKSGARILEEDVVETARKDDWIEVRTESGRKLRTRALILAMGVSRNKLGVPGEKELFGRGVSYCVDCDAGFYRGQRVALVGDESAASYGAMTMLFYADEVHLVTRGLAVGETLAGQVRDSAVIVHEGTWVKEIAGQGAVEAVVLENGDRVPVEGVFIELGAKGAVELAAGLGVALDQESFKFIVTDKNQATNTPGIFACGDICGPPWQVAKAVGEGCVAGLAASAWAKKFR